MRDRILRRMVVLLAVLGAGMLLRSVPTFAVDVGDKAPDFLMHSSVGETVQLSEYQGKKHVLLFFFLAAFTGV